MNLVWLHEDALRLSHPVFEAAGGHRQSVFIWDEIYLKKMNYSFKRLVFIYESLCELPVTILEGETIDTLNHHANAIHAESIKIPATPNPYLQSMIASLDFPTEIVNDTPFVKTEKVIKVERFFRYWNIVKKQVMQN
ncbi:MAG: hypothetical protein AAF410_05980 [Pseudomonadota bacterium]